MHNTNFSSIGISSALRQSLKEKGLTLQEYLLNALHVKMQTQEAIERQKKELFFRTIENT